MIAPLIVGSGYEHCQHARLITDKLDNPTPYCGHSRPGAECAVSETILDSLHGRIPIEII